MFSFFKRVNKGANPPTVEKRPNPVRFGVIGASRIAPDAIVKPARCHEEVSVVSIAARSLERAQAFAKTWEIPKCFGGANAYQELIDDIDVDAVYIGLPNSLHYEWAMKALAAGKHVLCEKPIANNEQETRAMFEAAQKHNRVLLEAWQPHFHPFLHRVKEIIDEGSFGKLVSMSTYLGVWGALFFVKDDIRFDYSLGGGGLMDMGPYPVNTVIYLASSYPVVKQSSTICRSENIDRAIDAYLSFPDGVSAHIKTDSDIEGWGPFKLIPSWFQMKMTIKLEYGSVEIMNYVLPHFWHRIKVIPDRGSSWVEKAYKPLNGTGEEWWTSYRYQLEEFVNKVRGRPTEHWRSAEDSVASMATIDAIYTKAGLPLRPTSRYHVKESEVRSSSPTA